MQKYAVIQMFICLFRFVMHVLSSLTVVTKKNASALWTQAELQNVGYLEIDVH